MKESVYLGIDVSKGYADFVLLNSKQEYVEPLFQLDDNASGHQQVKLLLKKFCVENPDIEIYCGLESTGGYERNWYNFLFTLCQDLPLKIALLNPVVIKGISKTALNRTITDEVSAFNIGLYLMGFRNKIKFHQENPDKDNPFKSGRSVYTYQKMLNKQKVQLNNQLEKLLYQYFPEVLVYCRHGVPKWLLNTLSKYPSAESIQKAGVGKLRKIHGVGNDKTGKIIEKARLNNQTLHSNIAFVVKNTCQEILHKETMIDQSKSRIEEIYKDHPMVKLLCTISGIGYSSAIAILFEIEDIHRFETVKKIAAYFGLNPEFKQSGDGTWGNHLSKKGRKLMRSVLYMACLSSIRYDPTIKKMYSDIRSKGKCHLFAMGVLMHKMLRVIFGVLKSNNPYDVAIDEKNRQKASEKQADLQQLKKQQTIENMRKRRRFQQQHLDQMPISNRKAKKIKELETP
jgi:transposase